MAKQAKVPVEVIYPGDSMKFILSLTFDGFDAVEITVAIEDALGIHLPDEIADKIPFPQDDTSLADTIRGLIECKEFADLVSAGTSDVTAQSTRT